MKTQSTTAAILLLTLIFGLVPFTSCINVCDQKGLLLPSDLVAQNDVIAIGTLISCDTVHIFRGWQHLPGPGTDKLPILVVYSLRFKIDEYLTSKLEPDTAFVWITKYEDFVGSPPKPFEYGLRVGRKALLYGCIVVDSQMSRLYASTGLYSIGNIDYYNSDPKVFAPYFRDYAVEALDVLQRSMELREALKIAIQHGSVITPTDDLDVMTYYCWGIGMHWHEGDSRQECRNGSSSDYVKELVRILKQKTE